MLIALNASEEAAQFVESMGIKVINNAVHYKDAYTASQLVKSYNERNGINAEVPVYDFTKAYARTMATRNPFIR